MMDRGPRLSTNGWGSYNMPFICESLRESSTNHNQPNREDCQ